MNKAAKITELCNDLVAERRACELEKNEALLKVDELSAEVEVLKKELAKTKLLNGVRPYQSDALAIKNALVTIGLQWADSNPGDDNHDIIKVFEDEENKTYISVKALHAYADQLMK